MYRLQCAAATGLLAYKATKCGDWNFRLGILSLFMVLNARV